MSRQVKIKVLNSGVYFVDGWLPSLAMQHTTEGKEYDAVWKDEGEMSMNDGQLCTADCVEFYDDDGHQLCVHYHPDRMELVEV